MKNILKTALIASVSLNLIGPASAHDEWTGARPDGHAPIGVMADHYHKKGEWMTSYRYMFMSMDGNRMGDDNLSTAQVAPGTGVGFPIVPIKMHMGMHMLGMMYAPSDRVTLMGMLNHTSMEMDHGDAQLHRPPNILDDLLGLQRDVRTHRSGRDHPRRREHDGGRSVESTQQ